MSLSQQELIEHCKTIMSVERLRNKIVILCEGKVPENIKETKSPHFYRKLEHIPDADFYNSSIPYRMKRLNKPIFYSSGDRVDVLNTFQYLTENGNHPNSYLDVNKLFALVDLDIQPNDISDYPYKTTETIYNDLYFETNINQLKIKNHRILVTGLIHKEAYFLLPELKNVFNTANFKPYFDGSPLDFDKLYIQIADESFSNADFSLNFYEVIKRVKYCSSLDTSNINIFVNTWKTSYQNTTDIVEIETLVYTLLKVRKAKEYWHKIESNSTSFDNIRYREQLQKEIGNFYSTAPNLPKFHITSILNALFDEYAKSYNA